jgi:hypothetical protein
MISASFDAWPRLSRRSQPKTRMMVRYRSRISTVRDLAPSRSAGQTAGHGLRSSSGAVHGRDHHHGHIALQGNPPASRVINLSGQNS